MSDPDRNRRLALDFLDRLLPWLERAPAWTVTFSEIASDAAEDLAKGKGVNTRIVADHSRTELYLMPLVPIRLMPLVPIHLMPLVPIREIVMWCIAVNAQDLKTGKFCQQLLRSLRRPAGH